MPSGEEPGGPKRAPGATIRSITPRLARATINTRLIAIVLTLAVPLNLMIVVVTWWLAKAADETQRMSLMYTAHSVAAAVDAEMGKYIMLGQALSQNPALQEDDLGRFEDELRRAMAVVPDAWALVADTSGRPLLNTLVSKGRPLMHRPADAIAVQNRAFETGLITISDVYQGAETGNWMASINVPIFNKDQPFRVLALTVNTSIFLKLRAFRELPENWLAGLRDGQGRLVARVPEHERFVGRTVSDEVRAHLREEALFDVTTSEGSMAVVANARSMQSNWSIGIGVRMPELRAAVFSAIRWVIALGGGISLLSLFFAIWIAKRVTAPLGELRRKAEALLEDPEIQFEPNIPELRELWATLQHGAANRFRSEARLGAGEKRLSQIINTYNGYVGLLDTDGRITEANVQMQQAIGAPREDVIGRPFADVHWWTYSPEAQKEMQDLIARCLAGETVRRDLQYAARDGEIRWITFQATPLRTADGRIDGVVPSGYDITDRKRIEDRLHQSETRFRNLYERSLAGISLSDWEGRIVECNAAYCNLVGYSLDELRGKHFAPLIHPDDRDDNARQVRGLRTGEATACVFENRYVHKNGTPVWVRKIISSLPVQQDRAEQFFTLCIDISEFKQHEDLLQQSEIRLQLALEADGAGMWENSVETGEFIASERALALHGLPPGQPATIGDLLAALHPQDRPKVEQAWRDTLENGVPFKVEVRCPTPNGSMRWLLSQGQLHDIGGQRRFIGLVRDISQRKAVETEVRISEMRRQFALDAARLGWWMYDPVHKRASWDTRTLEIFEIADPHADIPTVLKRVLPEDLEVLNAAGAAALDPAHRMPFDAEYRIRRSDGKIRWVEAHGNTTFEGEGADCRGVFVVGTVADITERKQAEEHQLLLMRELTHRTKNLLSVVQSIANQTAASSPSNFIERFSQRIQALSASQDLLVHNEWRGVEIGALVRAQLAHFADLIGERIMIGGPRLSMTPSAAQSIGMALHELATNAGKYGSLSDDHGSVAIDWRVDDDEFSIGWVERDGPRVKQPKRRGFGSTIISAVAENNLGGEVDLQFETSGVIWRLRCSASKALSAGA